MQWHEAKRKIGMVQKSTRTEKRRVKRAENRAVKKAAKQTGSGLPQGGRGQSAFAKRDARRRHGRKHKGRAQTTPEIASECRSRASGAGICHYPIAHMHLAFVLGLCLILKVYVFVQDLFYEAQVCCALFLDDLGREAAL